MRKIKAKGSKPAPSCLVRQAMEKTSLLSKNAVSAAIVAMLPKIGYTSQPFW
ncbi:hypothetical protein [Microbulbifer mangrovi]|uniref:hypothetical protein n=1 Tax=Microbulbifer mangrovi TaxID=927787 RepID=UPI0013015BE9|nr:hypothetical protein [Microbulbifer mangrovi]